MKNLVDLKNYVINDIRPQENYQFFILKELLESNSLMTYKALARTYEDTYGKKYKGDIKTTLKDNPTKVLMKNGFIKSDGNSISLEIQNEPDYYKESILWILKKALDHWDEFNTIKNLKFEEGIYKTDEEIDEFTRVNNISKKLVKTIILSINRGEKQIVLDGPPGTGKTHSVKKIIEFIENENSQSEIVQFHPSYGYEEFIEGLRPSSTDNGLEFKVVPGKLLELLNSDNRSSPVITKFIKSLNQQNEINENEVPIQNNNFYFVAQGGSYEIAKSSNNIWAPNKNASGSEQVDWNLLKELRVGDLIIHYSSKHIRAIGKVTNLPKLNVSRPYSNDDLKKREDSTYLSWEKNENTPGTLVEVEYFELTKPINKDDFIGEVTISENKNTKNSAFDIKGNISQKYLSILSKNFIDYLKENFMEFSEIIENISTELNDYLLGGFSSPEILTDLDVEKLPESPGVHLIYYQNELLYVGETGNTKRRVMEHMKSHHASGDTFIKHSQKKFNLDLEKEGDKRRFDELRSQMTLKYKITKDKEVLKNKIIEDLKPEFNKFMASVKNIENKKDLTISKGGERIVHALSNLGGQGKINDIYEQVILIDKSIPKSSVRMDLQKYSHDSKYFGNDYPNLFSNVSRGVWKLTKPDESLNGDKLHNVEGNELMYTESFGNFNFLIIDEINRGNLPKIFGELLSAFEYRDEPITLQYSEKPLVVPSNLVFFGTMNSTDKSVGRMDAALRRRFEFIHISPDYKILETYYLSRENKVPNLVEGLKSLNELLLKDLGKHCLIGQTFFMKRSNEPFTYIDIEKIWDRKIYPLLEEYFFDDKTELEKYDSFENFWPIEELEEENKAEDKKYSRKLLANDLAKISPEYKAQFEKFVDWSEQYEEFNLYLGRRAKPGFTTGGCTFIFQNNIGKTIEEKRNNKYHLFRITGKGKYEIRLQDLYSERFIRAPFNDLGFRNEFESKFREFCSNNNIELSLNFFDSALPGISLNELIENNCTDELITFWNWVISKIKESNS